jgi:hypothetical protein
LKERLQGRDATHRTRNLDTHLTHGCIQHFRHFLSGGSDSAPGRLVRFDGFPALFERRIRRSRGDAR